jgi:hypothetical protein
MSARLSVMPRSIGDNELVGPDDFTRVLNSDSAPIVPPGTECSGTPRTPGDSSGSKAPTELVEPASQFGTTSVSSSPDACPRTQYVNSDRPDR